MKTEACSDPIVDEIHGIRRKMLEEVNYDFGLLCQRLRESEAKHRERVVTPDDFKRRAERESGSNPTTL